MEIQTPAVQWLPEELWVQLATLLRDEFPCKHGEFMAGKSPGCICWHRTGNIANLASTCRFIYQIVKPLLFHRIDINCTELQQGTALIDSLERTPKLYANVHHLTIRNLSPDIFTENNINPFLRQFLHLHSLTLIRSQISEQMVHLLLQSTHLRSLELSFCKWSTGAIKAWAAGTPFRPPKFTSLRIITRPYHAQDSAQSCVKFFVPTLKEIAIFGSLWEVLPSMLPSISFDHVIKLSYEYNQSSKLQQFLERTPNLEVLSYDSWKRPPPFPLGTLSRLRSAAGPPIFIAAISNGRPGVVEHKVDCLFSPMEIPQMEISNNRLEKLCISNAMWSPDTFRSLGQRCPQLTWLEIRAHNDEWKKIDLAAGVPNLPRLQVLLLIWEEAESSYPPDEAEKERHNLEEIKRRYCPHLHEAQISPNRTWAFLEGWLIVLRGAVQW